MLIYAGVSGAWQFIERFSWTVIILGLPIAVYQLWLLQSDQNRVASELSRKPFLMTGFALTKDRKDVVREMQIIPMWPTGALASAPVKIEWTMHNTGSRTAREVVQNLVIPEVLAGVMQPGTYLRYPSPDKRPYIAIPKRDVNPGDTSGYLTEFPFPKNTTIIEVIVSTSMLDTAETLETLHIHVQGP
ncbi:MAG TPA: hypothetical protein VGA76_08340 [Candidatus Dormibacteraeota bacterium]